MKLKTTPPFTEEDKAALRKFSTTTIKSGRKIDDQYTGFTRDEALALILPSVNFNINKANFILGRALGELPDFIIDEHGNKINRTY